MNERLRFLFTGVGGQGILLATRIIGEAALMAGISASMSEVHGMAQRGGVVESSVVLGRRWSSVIGEGEADVLVALEPMEALRGLSRCHESSTILTNSVPIPPFSVSRGEAIYPDIADIVTELNKNVAHVYVIDAEMLAVMAGFGRSINVVMVGVLFGLGLLPVQKSDLEQALNILIPQRILEANIKALDIGIQKGKELQLN